MFHLQSGKAVKDYFTVNVVRSTPIPLIVSDFHPFGNFVFNCTMPAGVMSNPPKRVPDDLAAIAAALGETR